MSALQKSIMKTKLPPRMPRTSGKSKLAPFSGGRRKDYTPVSWKQYFDKYEDVEIEGGTFRVYMSAEPDHPDRPRVVTLHGGGYSGLSWSLFTEELTKMVNCQVISMDLRGHGETKVDDPDDLSSETLVRDVERVLHKLFSPLPPLVLAGHSMGGAVAVRVSRLSSLEHAMQGLAVIDVVEGTAMDALASMQSFLRSRPTHFRSIEHAIEWCVRSGQVRNVDSAKVSMPSQIINCETGLLATNEVENYVSTPDSAPTVLSRAAPDRIAEEPDEPDQPPPPGAVGDARTMSDPGEQTFLVSAHAHPGDLIAGDPGKEFLRPNAVGDNRTMKYAWRIELSRTERHWAGWFRGLSAAFLHAPAARVLLLASLDGLDRDLTVGQMQGKFQLRVLPRCGHAVHEDTPDEVARVIAGFMVRHRLTSLTEAGETMNLLAGPPGC